jgi:ribosomal protein S18 acetylase RimI-like enzyme
VSQVRDGGDSFGARRAEPFDADLVTSIIAAAFREDPVWSRAMARPHQDTTHHSAFWRLFVAGALRHRWTWLSGGGEAASLWIPPGMTEMTSEQEQQLAELAAEQLGAGVGQYVELLERFAAAHPRHEAHYYLSLLGTHPDHRGRGIGMALLEHDLALIDTEHMPAYLESSNPANNQRYARLGFERVGEFSFPGNGPVVTAMWRAAR